MANKDQERFWIEQTIQVCPGLAPGVAVASEAPDFLFVQTQHCTGVEVTRFAHPLRGSHAPEAELGIRRKLLRLAQRAYEELPGPPVSVVTLFSYGHPLRISSIPRLAREVADRVHCNV